MNTVWITLNRIKLSKVFSLCCLSPLNLLLTTRVQMTVYNTSLGQAIYMVDAQLSRWGPRMAFRWTRSSDHRYARFGSHSSGNVSQVSQGTALAPKAFTLSGQGWRYAKQVSLSAGNLLFRIQKKQQHKKIENYLFTKSQKSVTF